MDIAAEILVIILSVTLTVFLTVGIILTIYLIKLTRQIRKVTASAERTVDGIEMVVTSAVKMSIPVLITNLVAKFINKYKKNNKESKEK